MSVETPKVPNFLRLEDGQTVPICAITDDGLRALAEQWTKDLLARAAEMHRDTYGKERDPANPLPHPRAATETKGTQ